MSDRFGGNTTAAHASARHGRRGVYGALWALAAVLGWATSAPALILSGGPVYTLPGGGTCTVSGVTSAGTGATVTCTGVNLAAHTNVYFGLRVDQSVNGNTMTGAAPAAADRFLFASASANTVTYTGVTSVSSLSGLGSPGVTNTLNITRTAGSASIVSTGGNPADSGTNGQIQRLFRLTSGSSFTFDVDILANASGIGSGQACPAVYDAAHAAPGAGGDVSRVDLGFYYSDCGDGVLDSPEQCDLGGANGAATSCCTSSCTFRGVGEICRPGAGAPCDASETCTGASALCPSDDAPLNMGNVCRAGSGDVCDQNETCTGVPGQGCPIDDAPSNTSVVCRVGSVGDFCDQPETCTGVPGATCPADDAPTKINVVCRPGSGDLCDPDEKCTGVPGQGCPADVVANPSTVCRTGSGDACDPSELCTAVPGQPCPADVVQPNGTVCRSAGGTCDVAEQCSGVAGQQCPSDAKAAVSTPCNDDNDVCTVDACDGNGACVFGSALNCSDGVSCTQDSCDPQNGCQYSGAPSNSCASASRAVLKIRNSSSDTSDSVKFLWKGGPSLVPNMGDPTQTTTYELCIYDSRGVQMAMGVPPGAGWSPLGPVVSPKGYKYKDSAAVNDGVKLIKTKGSNLDKAQVKVVAKGGNVPDTEDLPLQYPVTAQVYASDGMCWEAQFSMAQTKKNDSGKFGGKTP